MYRATQGQGLMPDGTSRLSKDGKQIFHFMGCSTFAEYAVIAGPLCKKINIICQGPFGPVRYFFPPKAEQRPRLHTV
jgi:hypothetical protein